MAFLEAVSMILITSKKSSSLTFFVSSLVGSSVGKLGFERSTIEEDDDDELVGEGDLEDFSSFLALPVCFRTCNQQMKSDNR